jgi:CheY-like chemotaxis protein
MKPNKKGRIVLVSVRNKSGKGEMAKKILIIDDEKGIIKVVTSRLMANGYEVISATDGMEGLEKARNEKPDLVLLDIMMPLMSGYEVIEKLKKDDATKFIPVIMVTAQEGLGHVTKSMSEYGAVDFVHKPFFPDELLKKIGDALDIFGD